MYEKGQIRHIQSNEETGKTKKYVSAKNFSEK